MTHLHHGPFDWGSTDGWEFIQSAGDALIPDRESLLAFGEYVVGELEIDPPEGDEAGFISRLYCLGQWYKYGLPIFAPTTSLCASLLLTDPDRVPVKQLRFPFPAFVVRMPRPFWVLDTAPAGGPPSPSDVTLLWFYSWIDNGRSDSMLTIGTATGEDGALSLHWPNANSGTIGEMFGAWKKSTEAHDQLDRPLTQQERGIQASALRLAVNLSLFLAECHSQPSPPAGGRRRIVEVRPQTFTIGRDVKLEPRLIDAARNWTAALGGNRAGWSISKRFVVRGHFRNQVCGVPIRDETGKRRWGTDRRLTWVQPYWKGDGPTVLHRVYDVQQAKVLH